ncbi:membrane-associated protein, putative [Bodo saltans]|uniref:Membrane-associated protein, putative n=1 Tax=Bodo saltans TaxID=75058 RepID=A0A0S4ISC9_BODSA|nr:membrane-associated protein, putative [Bodo saltans]|eukprot:CUG05716.1 membrane-associated protein, putative [Bodo saltans]
MIWAIDASTMALKNCLTLTLLLCLTSLVHCRTTPDSPVSSATAPDSPSVFLGLWQYHNPNGVELSGHIAATVSGIVGVLYLNDASLGIRGFNATDGSPLWLTNDTGCSSRSSSLVVVGGTFLLICGFDHFLTFSPVTGLLQNSAHLAAEYVLTPMTYNANAVSTESGDSFVVVQDTTWVVLSVSANETLYGTLFLHVTPLVIQVMYNDSLFSTNEATVVGGESYVLWSSCGNNDSLAAVYVEKPYTSMIQVCSGAIMFVSTPLLGTSSRIIASQSYPNMTDPVSVVVTSKTGEVGVAVAWALQANYNCDLYTAVVFPTALQGWITMASHWMYTTPITFIASANGVVVSASGPSGNEYEGGSFVGWDLNTGNRLWVQGLSDVPLMMKALKNSISPGTFVTLFPGRLTVWNISTGISITNINVPYSDNPIMSEVRVCFPLASITSDAFDCATSTVTMLAVTTTTTTAILDMRSATIIVAFQRSGNTGGTSMAPIVLPPTSNDSSMSLLDVGGTSVRMYSLTVGWTKSSVTSTQLLPGDSSASFIGTEAGFIQAVNRGGGAQWSTPVASIGSTLQGSVLLSNDVLLTVLADGYTIAAYSTYNGSLLATLWIPSDCNATTTASGSFNPAISGNFVLNKNRTSAFFTAGFPCLLRVDSDLTIHSISTPWPLSTVPTIDEDNHLAFFQVANQIFAIRLSPTTAEGSYFLLYTFTYQPGSLSITPSSQLSSSSEYGRQLNPLVFLVFSTADVHVIVPISQFIPSQHRGPSTVPTIDEDNHLAFFSVANQLFAIRLSPTSAEGSYFLVYTFTYQPATLSVTPSSQLSSSSEYGRQLNPLVFLVFSTADVHVIAVDVLLMNSKSGAATVIWSLPPFSALLYNHLFYNNSLYLMSSGGVCRVILEAQLPPNAQNNRIAWTHGENAITGSGIESNIIVSPDGTLLFLISDRLYALDPESGEGRWSSFSGYVTVDVQQYTRPGGACVLSFMEDVYVVLITCPPNDASDARTGIFSVDALPGSLHKMLFFVPAWPTFDRQQPQLPAYSHATLMVPFTTPYQDQVGLIGIMLPNSIADRRHSPLKPPRPEPTSSTPITLPPGYLPSTPPASNVTYQYPTTPSSAVGIVIPTMSNIVPFNQQSHTNAGSTFLPRDLFPQGAIVVGPILSSTSCYFDAVAVTIPQNASQSSPPPSLWAHGMNSIPTAVCQAVEGYGLGTVIRVIPLPQRPPSVLQQYVVVAMLSGFSGVLIGLNATTGKQLWNSSAFSSQLLPQELVQFVPAQGAASDALIVVTTSRIISLDLVNGRVRSAIVVPGIVPGRSNPNYRIHVRVVPPRTPSTGDDVNTTISMAFSTSEGQLVVILFNGTEAHVMVNLNTNNVNTSSHCELGAYILLATVPNNVSIQTYGVSNYFYAGCIDAATRSNAILFRVELPSGLIEIVSNVTMQAGESGLLTMMVDERSDPMLYIMTQQAARFINTVTGATVVAYVALPGEVRFLLTGDNSQVVFASTEGFVTAVGKSTGTYRWSVNVDSFIDPIDESIEEQIFALTVRGDLLVMPLINTEGNEVWLGVNTTSGTLLYNTEVQGPNGAISGIEVWSSDLVSAEGSAVPVLITTAFSTITGQSSVLVAAFVPPVASVPNITDGCFAAAEAVLSSNPTLPGNIVATYNSLLTNFQWVAPLPDESQLLFTANSKVLGSNIIVSLSQTTLSVVRSDTGASLATFELLTECISLQQSASTGPYLFTLFENEARDATDSVVLYDGACVYQWNMNLLPQVELGVLDIGPTTSTQFDMLSAVPSAQLVLLSTLSTGLLLAVSCSATVPSILWSSDALSSLQCTTTTLLPLPYMTGVNSVARSAQQLVATCASAIIGLSLATGAAVWYELWNVSGVNSPMPVSLLALDGTIVVWSANNITKYNLYVAQGSHVVWSIPTQRVIEWTSVALVPNTNIAIATADMFAQTIHLTDGTIVWTQVTPANSLMFGPQPSAILPPATVLFNNGDVYSLFDGTFLYSFSGGVTQISGEFAVQCSDSSSCCLSNFVQMTLPLLPTYTPGGIIPYPTIPTNFSSPSLPQPASSVATPLQTGGAPYSIVMWTHAIAGQNYNNQQYFSGYYGQVGGIEAAVTLSQNGSSYQNDKAAYLVALHAVSGEEIAIKEFWGPQCRGHWLGKLNNDFGILSCHPAEDYRGVNFTFVIIDTRSVGNFGATLNVIAISQDLGSLINQDFNTIPVNDTMTCISFGINTYQNSGILCIDLRTVGAHQSGIDVLTAELQCPDQGYLVGSPVYSSVSETMWMPCYLNQEFYYGLVSMEISSDNNVVYNTTWDNYYTSGFGPLAFTNDQRYVACAVTNAYYNGSLVVVDVTDGTSLLNVSTPLYNGVPQFVGIHSVASTGAGVVDSGAQAAAATQPAFVVVLHLPNNNDEDFIAYDTSTGDVAWTFTLPFNDIQAASAVFGTDPSAPQQPLLFVAAVTTNLYDLFAIDLHDGTPIYNITTQGEYYGATVSPTFLFLRNKTGLLVTCAANVVLFNLTTRSVSAMIDGVPLVGGFNEVDYGAGAPIVVDILLNTGSISQVVLGGSAVNAAPLAVSGFFVVANPSTNMEIIVASLDQATYVLDGSGTVLWGTEVQLTNPSDFFAPIIVTAPTTQQTLLIKSATTRHICAFDVVTGNLAYVATIPLCGLGVGTSVRVAADAENNRVFISTGTSCLFSMALASGDVTIVQTFTAPLLPFVSVGHDCIVTITVFGDVQCLSRSAPLPTALWTTVFGFAPPTPSSNSDVPLLTFASGLLLVTLGERVIALSEETGAIAWEHRASSTAEIGIFNNHLVVASCGEISSIPLDPQQNPSGTPSWQAQTNVALSPSSCAFVSTPRLTTAGTIIVAVGNTIGAWNALSGALVFAVPSASGEVCDSIFAPTVTNTDLDNVFFSACGLTEARSTATGQAVAFLEVAQPRANAQGMSRMSMIARTHQLVFATSKGMTIELLPPFIAGLVPPVVIQPTEPPAFFTFPPGLVPYGVPTPAPTYVSLPSDAVPDASCVWAMQSIYPALNTCVLSTLNQSYQTAAGGNNRINCTSTAAALIPCVSSWLMQASSSPFCFGSFVYLHTALQALNHSAALGVCDAPDQCVDGASGASQLCTAVNSATQQAEGLTFPLSFLSRLPPPLNTLPAFTNTPSSSTPPQPSSTQFGAAEIVVVVLGTLALLLIVTLVQRRLSKKRASSASLLDDGVNVDPIQVSSRTGSELGSVHGSKRRLVDEEVNQERYASIN